MFNVVSNSRGAVPSAEASQPSTAGNNLLNADGNPTFARVVNDAMQRTTNNPSGPSSRSSQSSAFPPSGQTHAPSSSKAGNRNTNSSTQPASQQPSADGVGIPVNNTTGQQLSTSKSADSAPHGRTAFCFVLSGARSEVPAASKPKANLLSTSSPPDSAAIQTLFAPAISLLSPVPDSPSQCIACVPQATTSVVPALSPAPTALDGAQAFQTLPTGGEATPLLTQLQAGTDAVSLSTNATPSGQTVSPAISSDPTNSPNVQSAVGIVDGVATAAAGATIAGVAKAATAISAALQFSAKSAGPQISLAANSAADLPPKAGVVSGVSELSPTSVQGHPLSSVLQQIAALQGTNANHSSAPTVLVDVAQTISQSQMALAPQKNLAASSPALQASEASSAVSSSFVKVAQVPSAVSHLIQAAQTVAAPATTHSVSQDSSSNHSGQKPDDSSTPPDSSSNAPAQEKSELSNFSNVLSASTLSKADSNLPVQPTVTTVPSLPVSQQSGDSSSRPTLEPQPSSAMQTPPQTLQTPDVPTLHFVNQAQLTNAANQSEMRIAMQTSKLGGIEIHARVSGDEIGAAIIVEKHDAHAALAVELPALQQSLSDKQLRVSQVALSQGSLSSTADHNGANGQQNQRGTPQAAQSNSFWNESRSLSTAAWFVPEQAGIFNDQGRLSVQA